MSKGLQWITEQLESPNKGLVLLPLRFKFNTASAPTVFTGAEHLISSVSHDATGIWTITLKEAFRKWQGVVCAIATAEIDADTNPVHLQLGPMSAANGTIELRAFSTNGTIVDTLSKAVGHADLTDSDGSQTFAFASALPADALVLGGRIDVTAGFTDGSAGVFTADLGINGGDIDAILDGADIASIAEVTEPAGIEPAGHFGAITPAVTVLGSVNVVDANAGALTAYVDYVDPAGVTGQVTDVAPGSNNGNWANVLLFLKYSTAIDGSGV